MKVAFVHGYLQLGGIETLLLKLAREMSLAGHQVTVVAGRQGNREFERSLSRYASLQRIPVSLARGYPLARRLDLGESDILFACGAQQLLFAQALHERLVPEARLMAGVYIPWEYFGSTSDRRYDWKLSERLFRTMPDENIVFMNEACRTEHRQQLHRPFQGSPLIPLPVDPVPGREGLPIDRGKIVTIGRVVEFKSATWHMLDVLAELRSEGKHFTYHVYGDGVGMAALRNAIRAKGVEDVVVLHGTISYQDIPAVLSDAFLFVGYATSALEAAARGVPTLMGIESAGPETLGFVHETVEGEMGEKGSVGRRYRLIDRIRELESASESTYQTICRREQEFTARYSSAAVARRYLDAFAAARDFEFRVGLGEYARTLASIAQWKMKELFGSVNPDTERYRRRWDEPRSGAPAA